MRFSFSCESEGPDACFCAHWFSFVPDHYVLIAFQIDIINFSHSDIICFAYLPMPLFVVSCLSVMILPI
uniref:Uncharacterized protein n=1 Tax=Aegilops tauschii subsp. strangulata TaxID=200361 RepID=A0A453HEW2_AEGTS